MPKLYKNVVLWDAERESASLCDVLTEGAEIAKIAPAGTLDGEAAFDGRGGTAMLPGFVNAHGHAAMTMLRGLGEELPLMEWLQKKIWPVENKLDAETAYIGAQLALMEMLSTGTTCFADMYFFMDSVAEAVLAGGMRAGLSRGIVPSQDGGRERLDENLKLARDYDGANGLIHVQLGPHAPYTVPTAFMTEIAAAAKENGLGVQLHWLETQSDWPLSDGSKTMNPEEYLEKTGMTGVKHLLLAHCVWMEKEKFPFYARPNITVAHNPKSNWKLGSGTAPVCAMAEAGIAVSLGTDGASSNNRLDMWDEMRFASLAQKGANLDQTLLSARDAFRMATVAGARALGFEKTGLLREGWTADFMLVDLDKPHYVGWDLENLPGCIVYAGSSADVKATVVAGETLYENGSFTRLDKEKITAQANAARKRLTSQA